MSGKTFLAAFQVGSNLVPDAIDGAIKRGKLDAEKVALELQNKVKAREDKRKLDAIRSKEMAIDELTSINDLQGPDARNQVKKILDNHIFGMSQDKSVLAGFMTDLKMLDDYNGFSSSIKNDIEQRNIVQKWANQHALEAADLPKTQNGNIDYQQLNPEQKSTIKKWYYEKERFAELRAKSLIPKDIERGIFGGLTSEEKGDLRTSLKDVKKEKTVAQYVQSRQAFDEIKTLVNRAQKEGRTLKGPQDIAIVFKFMKALDPESVVREGEFATAANAGGVPVKVSNFYNKILEGQLLTPELRDSFIEAARDAVEGKKTQAVSTVKSYIGENEKLLPLIKDVPRYFEDILKQIESPIVEVDSKTKKKVPTVVPEDIGPFVNEEEANIYLKGLIKEGKPLPFAVQVGGKIIKVPAAERVNNKLAQQPSQASIAQGADDLEARKKEIEKELQKYKGSSVDTENKKRLESELVEVDAALRNLKQAKDPDASTSQKN